jgi:hypothetical protein
MVYEQHFAHICIVHCGSAKYSVRWCRHADSTEHQETTEKDNVLYENFVLIHRRQKGSVNDTL